MSFDLKTYRIEILAGLTVAMTMIPESLSFAIVAGLPPLTGLYGAFIRSNRYCNDSVDCYSRN